MRIWFGLILIPLLLLSCAKDRPYLSGHIKRAHDAVMVPCDPYGLSKSHVCIVFSAAFRESLYVYNATAGEMVLSPMSYFPLKIRVGRATDHLVPVVSDAPRVPFLYALDHQDATLYSVRLFPSDTEKSFSEPKAQKLAKAPFRMAAFDNPSKIIVIATYPDDGAIEILAFDRTTGQRDETIAAKTLKFGTKPNFVEIDRERKVAVFSDEQESNLHVLDLTNIDDVLTKGAAHTVNSVAVTVPMERIYLSRRNLGDGEQLYAVSLSRQGNDVALVNLDKKTTEGNVILNEYPMAAYFPDKNSSTCCSGKANWFSVVTIKGNLQYVVINHEGGALKLEKSTVAELTSESNLALGKLHVRKILGGYIEPDKSIDRDTLCSSNRQTFFISSYGNSRSYLNVEPVEQEAHGYSCEGEASAARFGYKAH